MYSGEIKLAGHTYGANIRAGMASHLASVQFEGAKKFLLSFNEHRLPLGNGVRQYLGGKLIGALLKPTVSARIFQS
jgi:hypothetical protein